MQTFFAVKVKFIFDYKMVTSCIPFACFLLNNRRCTDFMNDFGGEDMRKRFFRLKAWAVMISMLVSILALSPAVISADTREYYVDKFKGTVVPAGELRPFLLTPRFSA